MKKFILSALACAMAFAITGCDNSGSEEESPLAESIEGTYTVYGTYSMGTPPVPMSKTRAVSIDKVSAKVSVSKVSGNKVGINIYDVDSTLSEDTGLFAMTADAVAVSGAVGVVGINHTGKVKMRSPGSSADKEVDATITAGFLSGTGTDKIVTISVNCSKDGATWALSANNMPQ